MTDLHSRPEPSRPLPSSNVHQLTSAPANLARPIVILVDDDRTVHAVASRILASFSGTLLHSHDGEEALELALRVQPDLVITDALMPKLDGRQLAKLIKLSPETYACKVAVMTGIYRGVRYKNEAFRDFRVDAYLEKPVKATQLKALVESVQVNAMSCAIAG